ncbi:MAG: putative toxin-antitoxin system toxin component, PIN family [Bdellovibrionota bacterium]
MDTNVLVSGIFWKGLPREILVLWNRKVIDLVVTPPILEEYERVIAELGRKFRAVPVNRLIKRIEDRCILVKHVQISPVRCGDPTDQKFLDAATNRTSYLVTGDQVLLSARAYPGGRIMSPRAFLGEFRE